VTLVVYLIILIFAVLLWQVSVILIENRFKNRQYRDAVRFAESRKKPLLIAGGPWGVKPYRYWLRMPAHGGGDVCLDIDKRALRDHPCAVVADITSIPFKDKSFGAVFASHIIEHMPNIEVAERALSELKRVADSVFIVYPSKQSILAWVKLEHHLWLWQEGNVMCLEQRDKSEPMRRCILPPV
jgi:hypothetical protein